MGCTTIYPLACGKHSILDLDADEYGNFIALLDDGEVWTAAWQTRLTQQFQYPLIRVLDEQRFLVIDARRGATDNGFIFTNDGRLTKQFNAGDGVEDVLVQAGQVVISYFDEGIMGGQLPSSDGLAFFDFSGRQLFGFNSSRHPFIVDCHCMCKYGKNELLACTYPDYPLHEFTLRTHQLTTVYIPPEIKGAQALSSFREWIILYSSKPYQIESAFFFWDRKTRIRQVPFAEVPLRGIGNGKFLSYDTTSFTIIDAVALLQQYDPTTWYLK